MARFRRFEPVTVVDQSSPFYLWSGPVEHVLEGKPTRYVVAACYRNFTLEGQLWLTFKGDQLQRGTPAISKESRI